MMLCQGVRSQQLQRAHCESLDPHGRPERELSMCSRARAAGIRDAQADVTQGSPEHTTPWPGSSGAAHPSNVHHEGPHARELEDHLGGSSIAGDGDDNLHLLLCMVAGSSSVFS